MNTVKNFIIGLGVVGTLATATPASTKSNAQRIIRDNTPVQVTDEGPVAKALDSPAGTVGMVLVGGLLLWDIRRMLKRR